KLNVSSPVFYDTLTHSLTISKYSCLKKVKVKSIFT
ncbi:unnamed protein product, partial [Brassica rapa subsp. trilocularis]